MLNWISLIHQNWLLTSVSYRRAAQLELRLSMLLMSDQWIRQAIAVSHKTHSKRQLVIQLLYHMIGAVLSAH
jgi:hypothetical protein